MKTKTTLPRTKPKPIRERRAELAAYRPDPNPTNVIQLGAGRHTAQEWARAMLAAHARKLEALAELIKAPPLARVVVLSQWKAGAK